MFHSNYVPILHRFWDIVRYLSKIADRNVPHLYWAPPLGVNPLEFRRDLWCRKTGVPGLWLLWHCLHDPGFRHLSRTPTCECDGRILNDGKYCTNIASCCKNVHNFHIFLTSTYKVAVWPRVSHINNVTLHWAWLVLRQKTICRYTILVVCNQPFKPTQTAILSQMRNGYQPMSSSSAV